jgi:hypothetical protein
MQKTSAIVQRFTELSTGNRSFMLLPHQLMDVRQAPHPEADQPPVSSMARFFIDRVFEVHVRKCCPYTGQPAMCCAEFADFLLAWNYRGYRPSTRCALFLTVHVCSNPPELHSSLFMLSLFHSALCYTWWSITWWSIMFDACITTALAAIQLIVCRYFFRVLDVENAGRLSAAVVTMWCSQVRHVAVEVMDKVFPYEPADVKDEIFDMVSPKDPNFITLDDLMDSKLSDIICGILVDGQCHYEYDNREALQQQAQEEY